MYIFLCVRRRRRRTHSHGEFEAQATTGRSLSIHTFAGADKRARPTESAPRATDFYNIFYCLYLAQWNFRFRRAEPDK
jgi:hypothetical protein